MGSFGKKGFATACPPPPSLVWPNFQRTFNRRLTGDLSIAQSLITRSPFWPAVYHNPKPDARVGQLPLFPRPQIRDMPSERIRFEKTSTMLQPLAFRIWHSFSDRFALMKMSVTIPEHLHRLRVCSVVAQRRTLRNRCCQNVAQLQW
jgi:hypothetical protein